MMKYHAPTPISGIEKISRQQKSRNMSDDLKMLNLSTGSDRIKKIIMINRCSFAREIRDTKNYARNCIISKYIETQLYGVFVEKVAGFGGGKKYSPIFGYLRLDRNFFLNISNPSRL